MPPNHFESEVESFLEGSHGDRTHIKRADHHTVTPLCGTLLQVAGIPPGSHPKSSHTPPWSRHSISITSTKSTQLPSTFNAYQKLESAPNQRCMVIHSSEGSSARKRLVVNVNCQSHRTLQHQDRADLHYEAVCQSEPVHAHTYPTPKPGHALARPGRCLVEENSDVETELHALSAYIKLK